MNNYFWRLMPRLNVSFLAIQYCSREAKTIGSLLMTFSKGKKRRSDNLCPANLKCSATALNVLPVEISLLCPLNLSEALFSDLPVYWSEPGFAAAELRWQKKLGQNWDSSLT